MRAGTARLATRLTRATGRPASTLRSAALRAARQEKDAEENLRLAYPSTPASFFHLLREQGRSAARKPLVVFTPKSLLRAPYCVSTLGDLSAGRFMPVLSDTRILPEALDALYQKLAAAQAQLAK